MRELHLAKRGASRERWAHTSTMIAYMLEPHRDPKKRPEPYSPDDFNPFAPKKETVTLIADENILEQAGFTDVGR